MGFHVIPLGFKLLISSKDHLRISRTISNEAPDFKDLLESDVENWKSDMIGELLPMDALGSQILTNDYFLINCKSTNIWLFSTFCALGYLYIY